MTSGYTNIDSTLVALVGIVALLHMGTVEWSDVANNKNAVSIVFFKK
ncbi:MAG: anion permease [Paenibacillus sp.]|nr:anion permease [Paenibacillus sp.]